MTTQTEITSTVDSFISTEEFQTESTTTEITTTELYPTTVTTVLNSTDCINLNQKSDDFDLGETTTVESVEETTILTNSTDLEKQETVTYTTSVIPRNSTKSTLDLEIIYNITKNKDADYEYDYSEPTLPPSLPNLR